MRYNNALAANAVGDLDLFNFGGGRIELYNNIVSISGTPPALAAGNIAFANPLFVDLLDEDLRPSRIVFSSPGPVTASSVRMVRPFASIMSAPITRSCVRAFDKQSLALRAGVVRPDVNPPPSLG